MFSYLTVSQSTKYRCIRTSSQTALGNDSSVIVYLINGAITTPKRPANEATNIQIKKIQKADIRKNSKKLYVSTLAKHFAAKEAAAKAYKPKTSAVQVSG